MKTIALLVLLVSWLCFGCIKNNEVTMIENDGLLIDVYTAEEYAASHIDGAINLPHDTIGQNIENVEPNRSSRFFFIINVLGSNDKL